MKILLADDHALIREGVERALSAYDQAAEFVHASDRSTVLAQLAAHPDIDVILLDLFMPGADGFTLLNTICDQHSQVPVIVISGTEDPRHMRKSIDYGASGFIPKSADTDIMMSAIELVHKGGVYIPPDMLKKPPITVDNPSPTVIYEARQAVESLTERQLEVLRLMARGMSNKEIARELDISNHTIKVHVAAILKTLNASNRTEAVVMTQNAGVFDI